MRMAIHGQRFKEIGRTGPRKQTFSNIPGPRGKVYSTLDMDGRMVFDLLVYFRDNTLDRLNSYSLKNVCIVHKVDDGKLDMEYWRLNRMISDSDTTDPADPKWAHIKSEIREGILYCVRDSSVCISLMEKKNVWQSASAMSNIVGLNPDEMITRGQVTKGSSFLYRFAHNFNETRIVMTMRENLDMTISGGYVSCEKPGYYQLVACGDFNSMYPTTMFGYNLCYSTFRSHNMNPGPNDTVVRVVNYVTDTITKYNELEERMAEKATCESDSDDDIEPIVLSKPSKTIVREIINTYAFVSPKERVGMIPTAVKYLIDERNAVRKPVDTLKEKKDIATGQEKVDITEMLENIDVTQNALKIVANSIYGGLGAKGRRARSMIEMAATVTKLGRDAIQSVNAYFQRRGYNVVYNDTDSCMFQAPAINAAHYRGRNDTDYDALNKEYQNILNMINPGGPDYGVMGGAHKIALEKVMFVLFLGPKMYAAKIPTKDKKTGKWFLKEMFKGIPLARRDCAGILLKPYRGLIDAVLDETGPVVALTVVRDLLISIATDALPFEDFLTTTKYKGEYANENAPMNVLATRMRECGLAVAAGDRLEYVIYTLPEWQLNPALLPSISQRYATKEMLDPNTSYYIPGAKIDRMIYFVNRVIGRLHDVFSKGFPALSAIGLNYYTVTFLHIQTNYELSDILNLTKLYCERHNPNLEALITMYDAIIADLTYELNKHGDYPTWAKKFGLDPWIKQ